MELKERLITYIFNHHPITYTALENVAIGKGFSQLAVMDAMELVHKDKRITQTARGDEIVYRPYVAPVSRSPVTHTEWSSKNYPWPGKNGVPSFVMPFPEWDLSFLFLTPDELQEYKAQVRGRTFIPKKKYEHGAKREHCAERSVELSQVQRSLLLAAEQC